MPEVSQFGRGRAGSQIQFCLTLKWGFYLSVVLPSFNTGSDHSTLLLKTVHSSVPGRARVSNPRYEHAVMRSVKFCICVFSGERIQSLAGFSKGP